MQFTITTIYPVGYLGGGPLDDGPPLALKEIFSRQIFRDVNVRQRPKSLTRAIIRQLWMVSGVILKLETCLILHIGRHRTCDRDGPNGDALIISGRLISLHYKSTRRISATRHVARHLQQQIDAVNYIWVALTAQFCEVDQAY